MLAVGRFVDKKYPKLTIECFLEARQHHPEARLEMIGGGPALKECQKFVAEQNAESFVTLHGKQNSDFVASRLAAASSFVQHSVTDKSGEAEGLPSSIQEAMAAGCAICSTLHAGIPELVEEGKTGYLSPELDREAFTKNITKLLAEPKKTVQMGKASREVALKKIDYRLLYAKAEAVMRQSLK